VLLAIIAAWSVGCGDDRAAAGEARIVSAEELADVAADTAQPIYWLGRRDSTEIELTVKDSGRIYVRYLEGGATPGKGQAKFLTVGTYPSEDGVAELRRAARNGEGTVAARTTDDGVLLIDPASPHSAHIAYSGGGGQIEIYSPKPGEALRLASRGAVRPVP